MPRNDEVLTKKEKNMIKEEILNEINTNVKPDLVEEVVYDIRQEFNTNYKNSIKEDIKDELVIEIKNDIRKEEKKLSRAKSFKIFRLYIYLFALIACSIFMITKLYKTGNLDIVNKGYVEKISSAVAKDDKKKTTTTTTELVKDLEYYKNTYGYLVDNAKVSNIDLLKNSTDINTISMADKIAIAYNSLSQDEISVDGSIYTVKEDKITSAYAKVFGSAEGYVPTSFKSNNINYVYSSSSASYMAIVQDGKIDEYVVNNILNVEETENGFVFTCSVAYVKGVAVYSVTSQYYRIGELVDGKVDFNALNNKLSKVNYVFEKTEDTYKLVKIEKK